MARLNRIIPWLFMVAFFSLSADEVRVEPLEFWHNGSSWPETLSVDQLVESSLAASGLEGEDLSRYSGRLMSSLEDFQREYLPRLSGQNSRDKGEAILIWMHETYLTGRYRTDQTRMDVLMDRGDYNCVSSAILYLIFTRAAGLAAAGEETIDHAFCTLRLESGQSVDIETTTLLGFDPGTKKEFTREFSGRTGFAYVEPGDYARRQPASDKQMISLILQNRIALLQRRGVYGEAAGPAVDRWAFLPNDRNRKDMNDSFRNYVSLLNSRNEFGKALSFLVPLSEELGLTRENEDLIVILVQNQLIRLTNSNRFEEADAFFDEWSEWLTPDQAGEQRGQINDRKAQTAVERESYPEALALIRRMGHDGSLSRPRSDELITWLHQNRAMEIANAPGKARDLAYRDAMDFLDSLPEEERRLPGISDHRNRYEQNWTVVIHNQWAALMNRGDYDQARMILEEALAVDGTNSDLLKDKNYMETKIP